MFFSQSFRVGRSQAGYLMLAPGWFIGLFFAAVITTFVIFYVLRGVLAWWQLQFGFGVTAPMIIMWQVWVLAVTHEDETAWPLTRQREKK